MTRVTLLTDFGTQDGYVGAMKGVLASIAHAVFIDDIAHDIPPGDLQHAAWTVARYWRRYPEGAVHVVVVDPGVGSARRAIAARLDGRYVVAPDNGVLTLALEQAQHAEIVRIENASYTAQTISSTFHGRDIFAPAAAHLARGVPLHVLGGSVQDPVKLDIPRAVADPEGLRGAVVHIDRFGNLITNIRGELIGGARVHVEGKEIGAIRRTYADVQPGELTALIGSDGYLEVGMRDGSAAAVLNLARGAEVRAVL